MAKEYEITIKADNGETIAEATVRNGNWKYWDEIMETGEKVPVTINTIGKTYYLTKQVRDCLNTYDWDKYKETGELEKDGEIFRHYDSLLEYLICRMGNTHREAKFNCNLLSMKGRYSEITADSPVTFENWKEITVTIKRVE